MNLQEILIYKLNQVAVASRVMEHCERNYPVGQLRVLETLYKEDGLMQSYIAEVLNLRPSSLAELVKKLELKAAIRRVEDSQDKRIKRVYLTDTGRSYIEDVLENKKNTENLFSNLTDKDLEILNNLIDKMMSGWSDDLIKQTNRFIDPEARKKQMENFQKHVFKRTGKDMHELSLQELRELRKEVFDN